MNAPSSETRKGVAGADLLVGCYLIAILITGLRVPLRLDEILQLLASRQESLAGFMHWIALSPWPAPLGDILQSPFVAQSHYLHLLARIPALLFAAGSCYLFLRLAEQFLRQKIWPLLLFMVFPVHYASATTSIPFEQGLFLLLLSTLLYLQLIRAPTIRNSILYAVVLMLGLYTAPSSYLPAIGYLLGLLPFMPRQRRIFWSALPPTVIPVLLFVPYYVWARLHADPRWLVDTKELIFARGDWLVYLLSILLLTGALLAVVNTFSLDPVRRLTHIPKVCLLGGILSTLAIEAIFSALNGTAFTVYGILWAVPNTVILFILGSRWLARQASDAWSTLKSNSADLAKPSRRALPGGHLEVKKASQPILATGLIALAIVLSISADVRYLQTPYANLQEEAAAVPPLLAGDTCVVFVSEGISRALFLLFQPELARHECLNFFHKRIVLAIHPYVLPQHRADAESFFRGLNFMPTSRKDVGGGAIITMSSR